MVIIDEWKLKIDPNMYVKIKNLKLKRGKKEGNNK